MNGRRENDERSSIAEQGLTRGEALVAIAPQVDENLATQTVSLDDAPDLERATLVGQG